MPVFLSNHFKKQLKRLSKKFPRIQNDLLTVLKDVRLENEISIGKSIYKIRIKSSDLNRGKSGGFRSYIYFYIKRNLLVPLCIYAKSSKENITENEIQQHLESIFEEIIMR